MNASSLTDQAPEVQPLHWRDGNWWLTLVFAVLIGIDLLYLAISLASIPPYYQHVSTLTVEPYYTAGEITMSNEIVLAAAKARGMSPPVYAIYWTIFSVTCAAIMGIVGALVLWRARAHWFGWFTAHVLLFLTQYPLYQQVQVAQLLPSFWVELGALPWPLFVLYFFLFPNGRAVPRWARWPVGVMFALHFLIQLGAALATAGLVSGPRLRAVLPAFEWLIMLLFIFILLCQVYRYLRVSTRTERLQTKWFLYGFAVLLALGLPIPWFPEFTWELGILSMLPLPISIAISILRYRLWDIDVIIRRTLVYGTLTAILAAIYVGSVVVLQQIMAPLIGGNDQITIVASTLAIAALFQPLRRRIQNLIDRRFYRQKYDAQKTLQAFSARLRDETDLDQLTSGLVQMVQETLQPEHASIWLREPERKGKAM